VYVDLICCFHDALQILTTSHRHNTVVGEGYSARGVVRQPQIKSSGSLIIDMSQCESAGQPSPTRNEKSRSHKKKASKKEKKKEWKKPSNKRSHRDSYSSAKKSRTELFNPVLQALASQLSDTTRLFQTE
jgi:hypothetical protein